MPASVIALILACLSLPLMVYAGGMGVANKLPRPRFLRAVTDSLVSTKKIPQKPNEIEEPEDEPPPHPPQRAMTVSDIDAQTLRTRTDTGFSTDTGYSERSWMTISSGETYIRGRTGLAYTGLD
jgi:hypothetical protein